MNKLLKDLKHLSKPLDTKSYQGVRINSRSNHLYQECEYKSGVLAAGLSNDVSA
jgi:hypothetical protein